VILLAVVLLIVFVGPLLLETCRRVRVVNARERRRRAFHRDQEIRLMEADLNDEAVF
jgi:hypothetical protein